MRNSVRHLLTLGLSATLSTSALALEGEIAHTNSGLVFDAAHGRGLVINFEIDGIQLDELPSKWAKHLCDLMAPHEIAKLGEEARFVGIEVAFVGSSGTWYEGVLIEEEGCRDALPNRF